MNYLNLQPVVVLLVVALLFFAGRRWIRLGRLRDALLDLLLELKRRMIVSLVRGVREVSRSVVLGAELAHVLNELKRHVPVYSAETVKGREAEFIRDELPKRFPVVLVVIALLVLSAVAWWLSR
jgi:hypothetical protein